MNRICPSEEMLTEYFYGTLSETEKTKIETHIATCARCRELLIDTLKILDSPGILKSLYILMRKIWYKRWLILSFSALISSFFVPRYFVQLLLASLLTGVKWIMDSRAAHMMILVNDAWKRHQQNNERSQSRTSSRH